MKTYYEQLQTVQKTIAELLLAKAPYGIREGDLRRIKQAASGEKMDDRFMSFEVERGFSVSANVSIDLGYGEMVRVEDNRRFWTYGVGADGRSEEQWQPTGTMMRVFEPRVTLGWGSTTRSVANAVATIALYTEVTELAALAQTLLGQYTIAEVFRTVEQQAQDEEERKAREAQLAIEKAAQAEREAKKAERKVAKQAKQNA